MLTESELFATLLVPVVVLEDAAHAAPLAQALVAGGLPVAEVTFRTRAADGRTQAEVRAEVRVAVGAWLDRVLEQVLEQVLPAPAGESGPLRPG